MDKKNGQVNPFQNLLSNRKLKTFKCKNPKDENFDGKLIKYIKFYDNFENV